VDHPFILIAVGIIVGIYSGVMGLGGGTLMIPLLILLLGFTAKEAIGTSLAVMIPPVTLLAVIKYYQEGHVQLGKAAWIALGVLAGAYVGAWLATKLSQNNQKMIFGFVLVYVAMYTILGSTHLVRTLILSAVFLLVAVALYRMTLWFDDSRNVQVTPTQAVVPTSENKSGLGG